MSALPRPDLPPGPHRDLVAELHDLHHRDGWRSLRALARDAGVSHTTVSKALSSTTLPSWGVLELLVEAMGGDTRRFHALWLDASTPATDSGRPATAIAGRRAELAAVRRHLAGGQGLLLVTGEAGMGKTTLLDAAASSAGVFAAVGQCLPLGAEVPLRPVVDALTAVHEVDGGTWVETALEGASPHVRPLLARLLPHLGAAEVVGTDDHVRQHVLTAVSETLTRLAQLRPLAVVLEDVHWADRATLDLVEHLLTRSTHPPLAASWRTHDDATGDTHEDWFVRMRRSPRVTVLPLAPLTSEETAAQLVLLGLADAADAAAIHARSMGQPLFTEQLATHDERGTALPAVLADLLDRRLRGLSDASFSVVRALSIAARPLTPSQLTEVTALASGDLVTELRHLQDRRLVRSSGHGAVELQHPLLSDATRRRLVPGEAAPVHGALAEALAREPDVAPAEVAHHWRGAGDPRREVEWRVRAATGAAASYDWRHEADQWLRVLELWPSDRPAPADLPVTRAHAYLAAMDALKESLQWDRAAVMSDEAERSLGVLSTGERAELLRRAAEYRAERDGVRTGMELIDEALALYSRLPPSVGRVHALRFKRGSLLEIGDYDGAARLAQEAVEAARAVGDVRLQRLTLSSLAWHLGLHGDVAVVLETLARGRALVPRDSDPVGDVVAGIVATDVLLLSGGSAHEIEDVARPGLDAARRWEITSEAEMLLRANVAQAFLRAGWVGRAEALIGVPADQAPDPNLWPLDSIRALVDLARGAADAATARARVAVEVGAPDEIDLETLSMAAEVDFWSGEPEAYLHRLLGELDVVVDTAPVRVVLSALVAAARAAAEVGGSPGGHEVAAAVGALLRRASVGVRGDDLADDHVQAHLGTAQAELARASGEDTGQGWAALAARWQALSRPHDAAYCLWRAGEASLRAGRGTVAADLLRRAAAHAREHAPLTQAITTTATTGAGAADGR